MYLACGLKINRNESLGVWEERRRSNVQTVCVPYNCSVNYLLERVAGLPSVCPDPMHNGIDEHEVDLTLVLVGAGGAGEARPPRHGVALARGCITGHAYSHA